MLRRFSSSPLLWQIKPQAKEIAYSLFCGSDAGKQKHSAEVFHVEESDEEFRQLTLKTENIFPTRKRRRPMGSFGKENYRPSPVTA